MLDGQTYVNLHTDVFPGGEIRGQVAGGEAFRASDCIRLLSPGSGVNERDQRDPDPRESRRGLSGLERLR